MKYLHTYSDQEIVKLGRRIGVHISTCYMCVCLLNLVFMGSDRSCCTSVWYGAKLALKEFFYMNFS